MCSAGLPQRDVRFVQNSGPFEMEGGSAETITVGVVFVQPPVGSYSGCQIDVEKHLIPADEKAQALFDNCFVNEKGPEAPNLKIIEDDQTLFFSIENEPSSNNYDESYSRKSTNIPLGVPDSTYDFEAYLIYQIPSAQAPSFNELISDNQYKLVKSMDLRNDVERMDEFDPLTLQINNTIELNNNGLEHTFVITDDQLQLQGQSKLVNSKTYYYASVAIAYNNYIDSSDSTNIKFQLDEYKVSDEIKVFSAIPHCNVIYGISPKAQFGMKIDVTRINGIGHADNELELLPVSEDNVFNSSSELLDITYKGGKAPIDVTVTDPYKLRNADFTLTFYDTSATSSDDKFAEDSSYWELRIRDEDEGTVDVLSASNINRPVTKSVYAELNGKLLDFGINVKTGNIAPRYTNSRNGRNTYEVFGASITFEDSTNQWLSLVPDIDEDETQDWIRSGNFVGDFKYYSALSGNLASGNHTFHDPRKYYADILDGRISPYCITSNVNITDSDSAFASFAPGFRWRDITDQRVNYKRTPEAPENNLDSLFTCDIVITKDKNKWSECVVFETGDNANINVNGARKGQLIQLESVNSDGTSKGTGELGRGWFPGYAINLETGQRVNISFGENSSLRGDRAANMIWDPSSYIKLGSTPIMGGSHFVYVMNTQYDNGQDFYDVLEPNFNIMSGNDIVRNVSELYKNIIWTFIPVAAEEDFEFIQNGEYTIPNDVRIRISVSKPYGPFDPSQSLKESQYFFSTKGNKAIVDSTELTKRGFDKIQIVPNPYNAYSVYEENEIQNIIKIVGVPSGSKIKIYTTDGTLIRDEFVPEGQLDKYYGASQSDGETNLDNAYTWDMRTSTGVLISSGVYYIHVSHPDYGDKVLKLFATMRQLDVSKF